METDFNVPYYEWKILVVDDEHDVYEVTQLVFESITFEEKPVKLMGAYSASQARGMLKDHDDIALVLLDVVMETDHAGLDLVRYIREELGNSAVQIILRTGYPGQAPERKVIRDYDISDYWEKTELTADKLYTLVVSGLRCYKNYMTLQTYSQKLKNEIGQRKKAEADKDQLIGELRQALAKIKTLSGLLPICTICKKIRDDKGVWNQFESYLYRHTEADFSHSICPQCAKSHYPDYDIY